MSETDILIRSRRIFTGVSPSRPTPNRHSRNSPSKALILDGYLAIRGDSIIAIGEGPGEEHLTDKTWILELGHRTVCPGFVDVHCFFTGYALGFIGMDLSPYTAVHPLLQALQASPQGQKDVVWGHAASPDVIDRITPELLDQTFEGRPAVLFSIGAESCSMNTAAIARYGFTPESCYPEAMWRLLKEMLRDQSFIEPVFERYMALLNSRGVTAVKEMGFDDFYGFTDVLAALEKQKRLNLRVSFMSQPVAEKADIALGRHLKSRFSSDFLRFSGYNRMTDGSISQLCGDLKLPYLCHPDCHCAQPIDYETIAAEVLSADEAGFRFSLHAQGDAAIHKSLKIFERCQRDAHGRLVNRHSLTDIEFSDPQDLERMGKLGVIAEIYPQIQSIADREGKVAMIHEKIGIERGRHYWNRRKMADSDVMISCGTDLPLLIDNIPESIYHACGGWFPEGGEPFNQQNTLSPLELLTAWTSGGAYNLGLEDIMGTLEPGKKADLAILDADIFALPIERMREVKVCLTIINGKPVFTA